MGVPGPLSGSCPFPGSFTMISVTTPFPLTTLGHGGGISIADIPTGLVVHGNDFSEITTSFMIFRANPVGLLPVKTFLSNLILLQTTFISYFPGESSAYVGLASPLKLDLDSTTLLPLI